MKFKIQSVILGILVLCSLIGNSYSDDVFHEYKSEKLKASYRQGGIKFTHPEVSVRKRLQTTYSSCGDAWNDILYWFSLLYGDLYGN